MLIVADQPTWGLDIGAVAFVHQQLLDACARGGAVLLISDDLDEIYALADRIAVIHAGRLTEAKPAAIVGPVVDRACHGGRREPYDSCGLRRAASVSRVWLVAAPFAAVAFTLVAAALFVAWAGAPVGRTYSLIFEGGFGSRFAWSETLTRATPLILTGLVGGDRVPRALLQHRRRRAALRGRARRGGGRRHGRARRQLLFPSMMLAAMIAGALLLVVPALLRTRLGVDEVVTTLLLNFIVLLFVSMMLDGPMKDPSAMGWPQSVALPDELQLGKLVERTRVHTGLL